MTTSMLDLIVGLLTLTFLEIILGIDNIIFIAIATAKLPRHKQKKTRRLGLIFALITRLALLASVVWLVGLKAPLFTLLSNPFSVRDIILILGGLFLLAKATQEIHYELEPPKEIKTRKVRYASIPAVILQIGVLDVIFSLDSVFTAVGLTDKYWVMASAIFIAILTMIFLSETLSALIERHPTLKILALSFLLLIGAVLIADGFGYHVPREYIYFAISFSIFVELLNSRLRTRKKS